MMSFTLAVPQRPPGAPSTSVVGHHQDVVARRVSKAGPPIAFIFTATAAPGNTSIYLSYINNNIARYGRRIHLCAHFGYACNRRRYATKKRATEKEKKRKIQSAGSAVGFREFPAVPEIRNGPRDPKGGPPRRKGPRLSRFLVVRVLRSSGAGSKASRLRLRLFPSKPGGGRPFRY